MTSTAFHHKYLSIGICEHNAQLKDAGMRLNKLSITSKLPDIATTRNHAYGKVRREVDAMNEQSKSNLLLKKKETHTRTIFKRN